MKKTYLEAINTEWFISASRTDQETSPFPGAAPAPDPVTPPPPPPPPPVAAGQHTPAVGHVISMLKFLENINVGYSNGVILDQYQLVHNMCSSQWVYEQLERAVDVLNAAGATVPLFSCSGKVGDPRVGLVAYDLGCRDLYVKHYAEMPDLAMLLRNLVAFLPLSYEQPLVPVQRNFQNMKLRATYITMVWVLARIPSKGHISDTQLLARWHTAVQSILHRLPPGLSPNNLMGGDKEIAQVCEIMGYWGWIGRKVKVTNGRFIMFTQKLPGFPNCHNAAEVDMYSD